jgi:hypothetical protein
MKYNVLGEEEEDNITPMSEAELNAMQEIICADDAERDKRIPYDGHQNNLINACRQTWFEACEYKNETIEQQLIRINELEEEIKNRNEYYESKIEKTQRAVSEYFRQWQQDKETISKLQAQLKEKEQQWISVEERLPESNKPVWCFEEPNHQFTGVYTKGHEIPYEDDNYEGCYDPEEDRQGTLLLKAGWYEEVEQVRSEYDFHWIARKVTHWQPLPLVTKP